MIRTANSAEPAEPSSQSARLPAQFSGRRLTIVVLLLLLLTGGLFYWVTIAYSQYNAARRETDRAWRELAPQLDSRYAAIDRAIGEMKTAEGLDAPEAAEWSAARNAFAGTSKSLRQVDAAARLEQVLAALPAKVRQEAPASAELETLVSAYSEAAARQRAIGQTAGSLMLKTMLNLPEPAEFRLAPQNSY